MILIMCRIAKSYIKFSVIGCGMNNCASNEMCDIIRACVYEVVWYSWMLCVTWNGECVGYYVFMMLVMV